MAVPPYCGHSKERIKYKYKGVAFCQKKKKKKFDYLQWNNQNEKFITYSGMDEVCQDDNKIMLKFKIE